MKRRNVANVSNFQSEGSNQEPKKEETYKMVFASVRAIGPEDTSMG